MAYYGFVDAGCLGGEMCEPAEISTIFAFPADIYIKHLKVNTQESS